MNFLTSLECQGLCVATEVRAHAGEQGQGSLMLGQMQGGLPGRAEAG